MSTDSGLDPRLAPAIVHHILVVEDDRDEAAFLKTLLEREKYDVTLAKDAGQAHSMFVMKKPDFVILDLILPGTETGWEVCERLKTAEKFVPILILSAIELEDSRNLATRVGADAYLTKPFDPTELLAAIKSTAEEVWRRSHTESSSADDAKPVRFSCRCGKRFKVAQQHRGKTLTCPNCGEPVLVPRHE
ncbi:MAG: response regulator transcription factor [Planctomycetes bacterium]|nr:response regulator transcription factor [Planctomycetota bacterium]